MSADEAEHAQHMFFYFIFSRTKLFGRLNFRVEPRAAVTEEILSMGHCHKVHVRHIQPLPFAVPKNELLACLCIPACLRIIWDSGCC